MEPALLWQGPLHAFFHWWGLQTTSHFLKDLKMPEIEGPAQGPGVQ